MKEGFSVYITYDNDMSESVGVGRQIGSVVW